MNLAEFHTGYQVEGIDIVGHQPPSQFWWPNARFRAPVDFNSGDWGLQPDYYDVIHAGNLCGSVPSWERLYAQMYR